jgi:hypothetical protein
VSQSGDVGCIRLGMKFDGNGHAYMTITYKDLGHSRSVSLALHVSQHVRTLEWEGDN